jgi:ABC-2 type transport system ATP-binding protein
MEAMRAISEDVTFDAPRKIVRLPAPNGSQTLVEVVRRLDETGVTAQDVALRKPSLDDVFLTLTGRGAAAAEAESEAPAKKGRQGRRQRRAG